MSEHVNIDFCSVGVECVLQLVWRSPACSQPVGAASVDVYHGVFDLNMDECKLKGPLGFAQINERKEVPGRVAQVVELVVVVECSCPRLLRIRFRGC